MVFIVCITDKPGKIKEITRLFSLYNIEVRQLSEYGQFSNELLKQVCDQHSNDADYLTSVHCTLCKHALPLLDARVKPMLKLDVAKHMKSHENEKGYVGTLYEHSSFSNVDFDEWFKNPYAVPTAFLSDVQFLDKSGRLFVYRAFMKGFLLPRINNKENKKEGHDSNNCFLIDQFFYPMHWNAPSYVDSKISPRDMNCSKVIANLRQCYFGDMVSWKFLSTYIAERQKEKEPENDDVQKKQLLNDCGFGVDHMDLLSDDSKNAKNKEALFSRTIDFDVDPAHLVVPLVESPHVKAWFQPFVISVLNDGLFFRAAMNKRQRNVWCPGLAGIPVTPKTDDWMHEVTYLVHDLAHFGLFDLLPITGAKTPDGAYCRQLSKVEDSDACFRIYEAIRLMSELFTLPTADMLFVDLARQDEIEYKTAEKRKIYELFVSACGPSSIQTIADFEKLLAASVAYGVIGKADAFHDFQNLQKTNSEDDATKRKEKAAREFGNKYDAFIAADLRWTQKNSQFLQLHEEHYQAWFDKYQKLLTEDLQLDTILSFVNECREFCRGHPDFDYLIDRTKGEEAEERKETEKREGKEEEERKETEKGKEEEGRKAIDHLDVIEVIFRVAREKFLRRFRNKDVKLLPFGERQKRAFQRWAVAQMLIFEFQMQFLPTKSHWEPLLKDFLYAGNIKQFRTTYECMLLEAQEISLITPDDRDTFKEVYPFFPAGYVSYDYEEKELQEFLKTFMQSLPSSFCF